MPRTKAAWLAGTVLVASGIVLFVRSGARPLESEVVERPPIAGVASDLARVEVDEEAGRMEIVVGPVSIPARSPGLRTPIQLVELPVGGYLHGYSWSITDAAGRPLARELLHHVNLHDPDRRDLFSPTARRLIAAGRETQDQSFSPFIGYPLAPGTRLLVVAMFANPSSGDVPAAFLRVRLEYAPAPRRLPALAIYPFSLDVMGPVGEKSFAVPPGRTEQSWEGSPAVDARILAIGGHLHDYAERLVLEDLTTGETLWEAVPETQDGRLLSVPVDMVWKKGGIALRRDHRYRVTAVYNNTGDRPTEHGGMGVVAGIAHIGDPWPPLDREHPDYRTDLASVISAPLRGDVGHAHAHMH